MIYLVHPKTYETRTCETEATAQRAEQRGFRRTTSDAYRYHRSRNDLERLAQLRREDAGHAQQNAEPPSVPPGFTLHHV
jgi:hypothetical protein